ncbi:hypothetical protein BO71DRAFT_395831 [Aspergillus ellipticus CBS 707.79]|uniref:Uncharacterized protein n=1 Tax=Aspergillus ellipticus CBS 707.79 TaxID=1448320 RepID=A0A319DK16_9EURO|nr:hypothetical protein BO71DRAFT_395831 [Aspergillus ellipticus CBS 707.79]
MNIPPQKKIYLCYLTQTQAQKILDTPLFLRRKFNLDRRCLAARLRDCFKIAACATALPVSVGHVILIAKETGNIDAVLSMQ